MYPTNQELENAAIAAETGVWDDNHICDDNYYDLAGNPWPAQCLVSLADLEFGNNANGVEWLHDNLPEPYGDDLFYTVAIDNGKGKEVAEAIRSLKK